VASAFRLEAGLIGHAADIAASVFLTLNDLVLTQSLGARSGRKDNNKCYRRLKAWGLPIPDWRL